MSSTETSRPDLRSEFGLACPACGAAEKLLIDITCSATLTIDGTEPEGDHYWDSNSPCVCEACGHQGRVDAFRAADRNAVPRND